MASSNEDIWVQDLRKLICTNHGRGWRVNGEGLKEIKKGAFSKQSDCRANQIKILPVRNGGFFYYFLLIYMKNIFNRILGVSVDSLLV